MDEVKENVKEIFEMAKHNGVSLKIITGDSIEVATFVGLKTEIIKNSDQVIEANKLSFNDPNELENQVHDYSIFARTDPEQKYKILQALERYHHVGYLGDGINDAPSLKLANVSIVVDSATDIAKDSADIILTKKDLRVIIEGILDGREAFENINKYVKHTLVGNFGNFFTIGILSLFLDFLPMLPVQILLSNLLTDIPVLALSSDNVDRYETRKPKAYNLKRLLQFSICLGVVSSVFDLIFFSFFKGFSIPIIQTSWLLFSTLTEIFVNFSIRSRRFFLKSEKPSRLLVQLSIVSVIVIIALTYFGFADLRVEKLGIGIIAPIIVLTIAYFCASEILKIVLLKFLNTSQNVRRIKHPFHKHS